VKAFVRILACALVITALAAGTVSAAPDLGGYTIKDYTMNVVVSGGNVYDVTETIRVNFYEPHHGIYRDIRFKGTMRILDENGDEVDRNYRASVSDIRVRDDEYEVSTYNGVYKRVQIGNADRYVEGDQTYVITYKMAFGDDGIPAFDMLNFNLIGPEWNTTMDHVRFTVTMPDEFNPDTLGFSLGFEGASGYDPEALRFSVTGNTISGDVLRQMRPYEGLTVSMRLPQGYFKVADPRIPDWMLMGFIALLAAGAVALFLLFGRDEKPVNTVEFGPPDGMTPAELGYANDGCVDTRDVVSLILYWADKGYLTIEEGKGEFTLRKVRDIDAGAKPFEAHMFGKLFRSGDTVTTGDLKYTFYTTINSTKAMVGNWFERSGRRVFTKTSMALKPLLSLFTALPLMTTLFLGFWRDNSDFMIAAILTAIVGMLMLLPVFFLVGTMRKWRAQKPEVRIIKVICALVLCVIGLALFGELMVGKAYEPLLPPFAMLATAVVGLAAVFIGKRTPQGVEWLGKINGFRDFITLAERDRLVMMVEQNPSLFYNILPYAYVLNVTDKWAKNFETIALEPPNWYYGYRYNTFNAMLFMGALNHSMSSFQTSMTSTPSSSGSGGGGFSGGGFSGGGGGGGGGGSW
jgi:uncharacterized membrane protein YgcG